MTRKEKNQKLKISVKEIIESARFAADYYSFVENSDIATLAYYNRLTSLMTDIVSTDYYPEGRTRIYNAPSPKFSLNEIKEEYPRKYKRIIKEFKSFNFDYDEVKKYINSDNIFNKLKAKQNERIDVSGPHSKNVEKVVEKVESKHNLYLDYFVRQVITEKQNEMYENELRICKKDLNLNEIPTHFFTEKEVEKIANDFAKKQIAENNAKRLNNEEKEKNKDSKTIKETERQM